MSETHKAGTGQNFRLVARRDFGELEGVVDGLVSDGWIPLGGPVKDRMRNVGETWWYITVWRPSPLPDTERGGER